MSATIQALSDEAEVKYFTSFPVKVWLDRLKQLLYDADDILDEFATELLRLKLKSENQTHLRQTQQGIGRFGSKGREVNESLKSIAQEGIVLGLNPSIASGPSRLKVFSQRPPTSSLVNSSKVLAERKISGRLLNGKNSKSSR
ncbi:disease resistance protein RGA2-like [Macadamia integrifolia]|uniref:disease resistance protein RGA2-like n=1 Tax=Macadamia integrifolia TaxID=60698 RepID=UPI001C4E50D2|nr:disease resistance protein RGA2-like [Macadamia integrifolia]